MRHPYGETRNAEDERRSFIGLAVFALSAPLLADGFYNPVIAKSAVLYWTAEFITWIAWPTVWFFVLYRRGLTLADLGLTLPSPIYRGLLPFIGVTLLLFPLSLVLYGLIGYVAQIMISDNWLDQGFRRSRLMERGESSVPSISQPQLVLLKRSSFELFPDFLQTTAGFRPSFMYCRLPLYSPVCIGRTGK